MTEMSWCSGAHYGDIYDPAENPGHVGERSVEMWDTLDDGTRVCYKRYIPYEGYGRTSQEKFDFLISINKDHPLWSPGGYGKNGNVIGKKEDSKKKSLIFDEEMKVKVIGENEVVTEMIDGSDRLSRTSWNFNLMLANFVEKSGKDDRSSFFDEGNIGDRWSENMELMKDFKRMFDWIDQMIASDDRKKIALSDQSVKDYPRRYYHQIKDVYMKFMGEKLGSDWWKEEKREEEKFFKFNPTAAVFVPRVIFSPAVQEKKNSPPKPMGPVPMKSRPHSTDRPDHLLPWKICNENDKKILELDRKLEMLINLHGPVVEARRV